MCRYQKWVLALGIMAVTPGITLAGPFDFLKPKRSKSTASNKAAYNQETANKIAGKLRDAKLRGNNIEIEYQNGVATLSGEVASNAQKAKAEQLTKQVAGVRSVKNKLDLMKSAPQTEKPTIQQAAIKQPAIQQAADVAEPKKFQTPTQSKSVQQQPQQVASSFPKTKRSVNNQQTAEKIASALTQAGMSGYDIEIRYRNGRALLAGNVANQVQKMNATKVVSDIPGVNFVDNKLTVIGNAAQQAPQRAPQYTAQRPVPQRYVHPTAYQPRPPMAPPAGRPPMGIPGVTGSPSIPAPPGYGHPGGGAAHTVYNQPNLPEHAWPAMASYPNSAQVTYPKQYSASAWPYIGPFYPYPQVPLGWRQVQLEWDDGYWNLNFRPRTDKWWWFMQPKNW